MARTIHYSVTITPRENLTSSVSVAEGSRSSLILDATNKATLQNLLTIIPSIAADDKTIFSSITTAIADADASWDTTGKDAVKRLVDLIIADTDISSVVTAIAALE